MSSSDASYDPRVTPEQVREDLRVLLRDAQAVLRDSAKETFDEKATEVSAAIREKMATLQDAYDRSRDEAVRYQSDFEDFVRARPIASVSGAFVLGMIVACLRDRR